MEKTCSKCKETKDIGEFYKRKGSKDGYRGPCKKCHDKQVKKNFYGKHKQKLKQRREWAEKNRQKIRQYHKEWHRKNPQKQSAYSKKYYDANTEKWHVYQAVYNAVNRGELPPISRQRCVKCGKTAEHYHHDSYEPEDWLKVIPLCFPCHRRVHTKY